MYPQKIVQVKIEKIIYEGYGLGRLPDGRPVFVWKAVPGDELEIIVQDDKKFYLKGKIRRIITPSDLRKNPPCPSFNECGGCQHQNLSYIDQLRCKEEIFRETLQRAKINTEILPILQGSNEEFYYRNVIRFFIKTDKQNDLVFAMHNVDYQAGLAQIEDCLLLSIESNKILEIFQNFVNKNVANKNSFWQLRLRHGKFTNQYMIEIITTSPQIPEEMGLVNILIRHFPNIASIYHCYSPNKDLRNQKRRLLFGSPVIFEKIGVYKFEISPESFFQTNSFGVKNLYEKIKEIADIQIGERVLDLYCGTGTISIYLSALAKEVVGVEIVEDAIKDAKDNAKINHAKNCQFFAQDAHEYLRKCKEDFDVIIVDPPRAGLTKDLIRRLGFTKFDRLIYVSCNPATFARDINLFYDQGIQLAKVQPIDMFPQTHHIECVGLLRK